MKIRLFARAKDLIGADIISLDLPAPATVGDLRRELATAYPTLGQLLERSAIAVDDEFAEDSLVVPPHANVALLPPVSGGC